MNPAQILLAAGVAASAAYIVYALVQAIRQPGRLSRLGGLLVAVGALASMVAVVLGEDTRVALGVAILLLASGLVTLLLERARKPVDFNRSPGLLGMGAGALMLVGILVLPILNTQVLPQLVTASAAGDPSPTSMPVPAQVVQNVIPVTPIPARSRPLPTPTPTPTPFIYVVDESASTPQAVLAAAEGTTCDGTVTNNLNLRSGAGTGYPILVTIPFSTRVEIAGQDASGVWLSVTYAGETGWVSADYVTLDGCGTLPTLDA